MVVLRSFFSLWYSFYSTMWCKSVTIISDPPWPLMRGMRSNSLLFGTTLFTANPWFPWSCDIVGSRIAGIPNSHQHLLWYVSIVGGYIGTLLLVSFSRY